MKYLFPLIWIVGAIFAVPFAVMSLSGYLNGTFLDEYFSANVLILALPQLIWALIGRVYIPRSAYIGGFIAGNSLLIFTVLWYFIVITQNDPYKEGFAFAIGFFYLPYSWRQFPSVRWPAT